MKKILLVSLVMACLPALTMMAQDDLYFVPKKKVEKKTTTGTPAKVVVETGKTPTTVYAGANTTVVIKDIKGNVRDVDEYNRRYTSRDNEFTVENDTLYIEEKPYNERGEWVNGFDGTQEDYEYAMRIIRFRNPRFAIPVSSPLYWDVIYSLPSWEWNVFDDGFYAYAFPTYSNRLWWDWRWNYPWGSSWTFGGWYSPWYNHWYGNYWYGGYWGGYWGHHHHWHPHYHRPIYAGVGGYWGGGHGRFGSSALRPGIHAGRYISGVNRNTMVSSGNRRQVAQSNSRNGRDSNVNTRQTRRSNTVNKSNATQDVRRSAAGRVVRSNDNSNSVRPRSTTVRTRKAETVNSRETSDTRSNNNSYVRSTERRGSSYNRPSSTRSSVTNRSNSSYQQRSGSSSNQGSYRSNSSSRSSRDNSTYRSNSNTSRSSGSSFSSGSGSTRSSAGGSLRSGGSGGSRGSRR